MFKAKYLLFFLASFIFLSCVDEDSMLGMGLVDQSDMLNIKKYDDFDISAYIYHEGDSLKTSNSRYMTLGSYKDNVFGEITTSIYTQVSLSSTTMDFSSYTQGQANEADSIVLTIAYNGMFVKDTNMKEKDMKIEVFELSQGFDTNVYFTNSRLEYNPSPIISQTIKVSPKESVLIMGDSLVPHLRVNLGNGFLNQIVSSGSFSDNESFLNFFKGIYIKLTPISAKLI